MKGRIALLGLVLAASSFGALAACGDSGSSSPPSVGPDVTAGGDGSLVLPDAIAPSDGGDAGDGSPGPDLGPMAAYCDQLAAATCARRAYCSGQADPSCVTQQTASCRRCARGQMVEALGAGLIAYDPAKAAACFATPFDDYCQPNDFGQLEACRGVFTGTVAMNGACLRIYFFGDVDECATGRCSAGEVFGTCTSGTCGPFLASGAVCMDDAGAAIPPGCAPGQHCADGICRDDGQPGDPCTSPAELCRPLWPQVACAPLADGGLACDRARDAGALCAYQGTGVDEVCRSQTCGADGGCTDTLADGGITCASPSPPCPSGTACQSNAKGTPPSCQPPRAAGAPCATGDTCVDGYACTEDDAGVASCTALPAVGQPCTGACASGAVCSKFKSTGTCAAVVGQGGACRAAGDDTCAPGLTCNGASKTCAPAAPVGAACTADTDCESGLYCDDATTVCTVWKRNGQPCSRDGQCVFASGCTGGVCASACTVP